MQTVLHRTGRLADEEELRIAPALEDWFRLGDEALIGADPAG